MNSDKELKHSKSKAQWWRLGLILGLIFTFGIINYSCEESDEYYVKYEVISDSPTIGRTLHTTINTEDNENETFTFGSSAYSCPIRTVIPGHSGQ